MALIAKLILTAKRTCPLVFGLMNVWTQVSPFINNILDFFANELHDCNIETVDMYGLHVGLMGVKWKNIPLD